MFRVRSLLDALRTLACASVALLVLQPSDSCHAAIFHLSDGSKLEASYVGEVADTITVLTAEGKRRELKRGEILTVDWSHQLSPRLEKRAKKERGRFLKKRRDAALKIARKMEGKRKAEDHEALFSELSAYSELERVTALDRLLRSKRPELRTLALGDLSKFQTDAAVVSYVKDSLVAKDKSAAAETHALAVARNSDLSRRLYEYSAQVSPFAQRIRAIDHLKSIGSRNSGRTLVRVLRYVTTTIRVQLARTTALKEIPISLGSLNTTAQQVVIETPAVELIEVMTTAQVPVEVVEYLKNSTIEALEGISGESHGDDLKSWDAWLATSAPSKGDKSEKSDPGSKSQGRRR